MIAYEIYYRDETDKVQLIGILPERRKMTGELLRSRL